MFSAGASVRSTPDSSAIDEDEVLISRETDEPTYKEAMSSPDAGLWKVAMKEELEALDRNNTWEVVDRPPGRRIVDSKWVFRIKRDADGTVE